REGETMEVALGAAATGHVVFSTLDSIDASITIEGVVGAFPPGEQSAIRMRMAKTFRYIVSQRLVPRMDGNGRVAVFEILKSTLRTREYVQKGETEGKSLLDTIRDGGNEGMQCFDDEIEKLIRSGTVDLSVGLSYATNAGNLRLQLADLIEPQQEMSPPEESASETLQLEANRAAGSAEPELEPHR
ncbi:MAG: twitching motility protein, partial [Candidatus Acidiferrales bacterium]